MVSKGQLPFTPRGKQVLVLAMEEANSLGHGYIGTEHLLLGLLGEPDGVGGQVLHDLGLDLEKVRQEVAKLLPLGPKTTPQPPRERQAPGRVEVRDVEGKVRARLDVMPDGSPRFELFDASGVARLVIALGAEGEASIECRDAGGKVRRWSPEAPDR